LRCSGADKFADMFHANLLTGDRLCNGPPPLSPTCVSVLKSRCTSPTAEHRRFA
jgi:hypothetical protein